MGMDSGATPNLGRTGFFRAVSRLSTTPSKDCRGSLSDQELQATLNVLKYGGDQEKILACQLLAKASVQLVTRKEGNTPIYLEPLTTLLTSQSTPHAVRNAVVKCLTEFGALYQQRGDSLKQWIVSRILDMVEREYMDKGTDPNGIALDEVTMVLQAIQAAKNRFEFLPADFRSVG